METVATRMYDNRVNEKARKAKGEAAAEAYFSFPHNRSLSGPQVRALAEEYRFNCDDKVLGNAFMRKAVEIARRRDLEVQ